MMGKITMVSASLMKNITVTTKNFNQCNQPRRTAMCWSIYHSLLNTPTVRLRDGVLPASPLLSSKRQGNEVESVNTPTVRSWEVYFYVPLHVLLPVF
jgi:hypothetical protein